MSGELISLFGGKVPQRAIRYLDKLPYAATYELEENNTLLGVDFGGSASTYIIQSHPTKRMKWIEALVYKISENFAGTTKSSIDCGDGSDADGFGYTDDFVDAEMTTSLSKHFSSANGSINVGALGEIIEAGDMVTMTCNAAATGPTGIGRVAVTFLYFD